MLTIQKIAVVLVAVLGLSLSAGSAFAQGGPAHGQALAGFKHNTAGPRSHHGHHRFHHHGRRGHRHH